MARDWFINGESLVQVKGATGTAISALSSLGLAEGPIRVTPNFRHIDLLVDAWGSQVPAEVQWMLADVQISMSLVHFDRDVLDTCLALSMGGGQSAVGQVARAGARLGNNVARFVTSNRYIGLNITSPVAAKPWRFYFTYLTGPPMEFPLGTERSIVTLNWRAIPYTTDPYQGGVGATNQTLWDHTLDT